MKKQLFLAAAAVIALSSVGVAQARDNIGWSVSIGDPYIGAVISNEYGHGYGHGNRHDRGHRYAPRVHVVPPVVYAPPPRIVYQQPYVYAPYGYAPYGYEPYGYEPHRYAHSGRDRWDHRHGGHRRGQGHYDRDDRRDHRDHRRDDRRDNHRDDRDDRHDDRWQRR